jgi:hypothetical protein
MPPAILIPDREGSSRLLPHKLPQRHQQSRVLGARCQRRQLRLLLSCSFARIKRHLISLHSGLAYLLGPLSYAASSYLSGIFIDTLGYEMTHFVRNTSQQGLKTPEHAGGQINSPGLQAGERKFGLVCLKGLARLQE